MVNDIWMKNRGLQGYKGDQGISIEWQGELQEAPENPQLNWAYYDEQAKKSYIYDGSAWGIVAQDGVCSVITKTMLDGESTDLVAQKTVIYVDVTLDNATITINDLSYNGQEVGVYPTGDFTVYINGTGLTDATAKEDEIFRAEAINDTLIEIVTGADAVASDSAELSHIAYYGADVAANLVAKGYIPFSFDSVSTGLYPDYYALVGDQYDAAHVAAGQPSLIGTGSFYPTPVPGSYGRSALPDIEFTDANVQFSSLTNLGAMPWFRNGTAFVYKETTASIPELTDGEIYYMQHNQAVGAEQLFFHTSESDAISNSNKILITVSGSGTFKLVQAGIGLDDAFQGHDRSLSVDEGTTNIVGRSLTDDGTSQVSGVYASNTGTKVLTDDYFDSGYGTPKITNETRPSTFYEYAYIKVENVITSDAVPVSEFQYDTGDVANNDFSNKTWVITHNLGATVENLDYRLFLKAADTGNEYIEPKMTMLTKEDTVIRQAGYTVFGIDENSFKIHTGDSGIYFVRESDGFIQALGGAEVNGFYKVKVTKKNFAPVVLNTSFSVGDGQTVGLTSARSVITCPTGGTITIGVDNIACQELVVKNTHATEDLKIIDATGVFPEPVVLTPSESITCNIVNKKFLISDFKTTVYLKESDLENGATLNLNYPLYYSVKNGEYTFSGIASDVALSETVYIIPEYFRRKESMFFICACNANNSMKVGIASGAIRNETQISGSSWTATYFNLSWKINY